MLLFFILFILFSIKFRKLRNAVDGTYIEVEYKLIVTLVYIIVSVVLTTVVSVVSSTYYCKNIVNQYSLEMLPETRSYVKIDSEAVTVIPRVDNKNKPTSILLSDVSIEKSKVNELEESYSELDSNLLKSLLYPFGSSSKSYKISYSE